MIISLESTQIESKLPYSIKSMHLLTQTEKEIFNYVLKQQKQKRFTETNQEICFRFNVHRDIFTRLINVKLYFLNCINLRKLRLVRPSYNDQYDTYMERELKLHLPEFWNFNGLMLSYAENGYFIHKDNGEEEYENYGCISKIIVNEVTHIIQNTYKKVTKNRSWSTGNYTIISYSDLYDMIEENIFNTDLFTVLNNQIQNKWIPKGIHSWYKMQLETEIKRNIVQMHYIEFQKSKRKHTQEVHND